MWFAQLCHDDNYLVISIVLKNDVDVDEASAIIGRKYIEYSITNLIWCGQWQGEVEL